MSSSQGRVVYDYSAPTRVSKDHVTGRSEHGENARLVTIRQNPRDNRDLDQYVRPRIRTNSLDPGEPSSRRPLDSVPRSPAKNSRPVITRDIERSSSPPSKAGGAQLEASYIVPASSSSGRHHFRHSSLTSGDRLSVSDRGRERDRERIYPSNQSSAATSQPLRPVKDERDYGHDYKAPREQVVRDLAPPPQRRIRSGSHTGARPTSMIEFDRPEKIYARTEKDAAPPASVRGFDVISRNESLKHSSRALNDDLGRRDSASRRYPRDERADPKYRDIPRPSVGSRDEFVAYPAESNRYKAPRQSTLEVEAPPRHRSIAEERDDRDQDRHRRHHHHHARDADGPRDYDDRHERHRRRDTDEYDERNRRNDYPEKEEQVSRKEYDDRYERDHRKGHDEREERGHRRYHDNRDERERRRDYDDKEYRNRGEARDREHSDDVDGAPSHLGLLAAGGTAAAAGLAVEGSRRHRHKDENQRPSRDAHGYHPDRDHIENATTAAPPLTEEEEREERRRRRRKEREREERMSREAIEDTEREPLRIEAPPASEPALREQKSYERRPEGDEPSRRHRRRRHHRPRSSSRGTADSKGDDSDSSDSDSSADRVSRTPRVVSPPNDALEAMAPKPAPKGILKRPREKFPEDPHTVREGVAPLDAAKKGIPPEARWTRINRRLVNPEALEQEGIRFEEYPDYVIVLKVLAQEDIAKLTKKTHEIREKRRLEQGSQGSGSGSGGGASNEDAPPPPL